MTPQSIYPWTTAQNLLGEGPLWSVEEQAFYWIDIDRPALQRWNPETHEYRVWELPSKIGSYSLKVSGGAILALKNGFHSLDLETGTLTFLSDPEAHLPENRFNDGKCDPKGRFWAGSLHEKESEPLGTLYRYDPDGTTHIMRRHITVSNGIGWSPDHTLMYFTDSGAQTIYVYDFEVETGAISNERIFAQDTDCYPDGLTVDSEGCVWSAKWDGWRIVCYFPDGQIKHEISMPVQRPTSCMFGGPNLKHLYVTSASVRLSEEELAAQPLAGNVFRIETEVPGLPETHFAG